MRYLNPDILGKIWSDSTAAGRLDAVAPAIRGAFGYADSLEARGTVAWDLRVYGYLCGLRDGASLAQARAIHAEHDRIVHSDGSECPDGCGGA